MIILKLLDIAIYLTGSILAFFASALTVDQVNGRYKTNDDGWPIIIVISISSWLGLFGTILFYCWPRREIQ